MTPKVILIGGSALAALVVSGLGVFVFDLLNGGGGLMGNPVWTLVGMVRFRRSRLLQFPHGPTLAPGDSDFNRPLDKRL